MTKSFKDMPQEQQKELVGKICDVLVECGLDDVVKPKFYMESVCPLKHTEVMVKAMLMVKGACPASKSDKVKEFNERVKDIVEGVEGIEIAVTCNLGAGDPYDTIKDIVPMQNTGPIDLVHKAGEVWLLDFWATWCPPCQAPMAHNQKMLEERGEEWGKNVRIIGLSIDKDLATLVKHVTTKEWTKVEHYHRDKSNMSE